MSPQDFLLKAQQRWRRLPDSQLAECNDEEKATVRALEDQAIQMEFAALTDIVLHCTNKYQFAKTYKVLRDDLRKNISQADGNPSAPPHVNRAVKATFEQVGEQKLSEMAGWFLVNFTDEQDMRRLQNTPGVSRLHTAIEFYAGKEGSGCAGVVILAINGALGLLAWVVA
ncbi:MAG TPA: hypothetical protein VM533_15445 [Fimbriiglobus sp.]|jgi:hypothetical protein|nr:hypothetical protein [Fimbriiglobus sp.]